MLSSSSTERASSDSTSGVDHERTCQDPHRGGLRNPDVRAVTTRRAVERSLIAGFAGTAAMTLTTRLQARLGNRDRPIDYDDSPIVIKFLERWTPLRMVKETETVLNQVIRFGYGSATGLIRHVIERRVRRPAVVLFSIMWASEAVMLCSVGEAPPPWRWKRAVMLTSLAQHVVYAAATDIAYRTTRMHPDHPTPDVDQRGSRR